MKQTAIMLVVLVALVTGSLGARADTGNPFGFETNKHPLEYEYCKKDKDPENSVLRGHGYTCSYAPRPHPDFQEYFLLFVEDVGLCSVSAYSNYFAWREKLVEFEMFKDQIAKKYGPPTDKRAGRDVEPFYRWSPKTGFKGSGDVKAIELVADRFKDGYSKVRVTVVFWLGPFNGCLKKIDDKADRAF